MAKINSVEILYHETNYSRVRYNGETFSVDECDDMCREELEELRSSITKIIMMVFPEER